MTEPTETADAPEPESPEQAPDEPSEPAEASREGDGQGEEPETAGAPAEPPVPETEALSEKDIEQAFSKLDREATRHANRVSEIMEEGAQLLVKCPLCEPSIPGFIMPSPAIEERKPGVLLFLGVEEEPELESDPDSSQCPTCKGWGKVKTGSRTEANSAMVCRQCNGAGAVGARFEAARLPSVVPAPLAEQNGPQTPSLSPEEEVTIAALRAKGVVVIPPVVQVP